MLKSLVTSVESSLAGLLGRRERLGVLSDRSTYPLGTVFGPIRSLCTENGAARNFLVLFNFPILDL